MAQGMKQQYRTIEEDQDIAMEVAWDDVSRAELDTREVKKARQQEIQYVRKMNLYDQVSIEECYRVTGKAPISVRWVDISKGDVDNPNYRSWLVAREINTHKSGDSFAATPPLEALKIIRSMITTSNKGDLIMINDLSRASSHAKAKRQVCVQFADEDIEGERVRLCGRRNYSMYGTRDVAQNWFDEYSQQLLSIGYTQGAATPCIFYNHEKDIRTFVHGDDYVSIGKLESPNWLREQLAKKYRHQHADIGAWARSNEGGQNIKQNHYTGSGEWNNLRGGSEAGGDYIGSTQSPRCKTGNYPRDS